jgi:hypothetical protein
MTLPTCLDASHSAVEPLVFLDHSIQLNSWLLLLLVRLVWHLSDSIRILVDYMGRTCLELALRWFCPSRYPVTHHLYLPWILYP